MCFGFIKCERFVEVFQSQLEISEVQICYFESPVCSECNSGVGQTLAEFEKLFGKLARSVQFRTQRVERPQSPEHFGNIRRVA